MLPANLHHCDLLWSPLDGDGAGWIPMMPSESLRGSEVHTLGVAKVHRRLLSPTISCTAAASWKATWRQREGNVKATWRQREGNVKATWIKWKHPIESSLQDPIKINSRTFKLFQQCWCLVFVLFLLTAATSVLQKQPCRSGMGQNWCANSLDKFVYVQHQKAFNHPFVGMFTQYIEIRSIIFMLEVKIHKFHTHVLIHMFPGFSWIIKKIPKNLAAIISRFSSYSTVNTVW